MAHIFIYTLLSDSNVEVIGFTLTGNEEDLLLNVTNNSDGVLKISQIAIYNEALVRGLVEPDAFPITLEVGKYNHQRWSFV